MGNGNSSESGEQPNKKMKNDDDDGPTSSASTTGQTRIVVLAEREVYRLSIGNYLTADIEGGNVGSFTITREVVTIHDAEGNLVFSGQTGDLITIEDVGDDFGNTSIVISESGGKDSTESNVEIFGGNLYDVTFTFKGSGTAPNQQNSLQNIASKTLQNIRSSSSNNLGVVPRNNDNQGFQPDSNVQGGLIAQTPKTIGLLPLPTRLPQTGTGSLPVQRQ